MVTLSLTVQWLVFASATAIAALLMRFLRSPKQQKQADDISYLQGKQVKVIETISPRGRVVYKSVTWAAESDDKLEVGASASVFRVHGSTLHVIKLEENI